MSSPNFIWYYLANMYFPKELLTSNIMDDLSKRTSQIHLLVASKPIGNFVSFGQELRKSRTRVHKFGEELSKPNTLVS